MTMHLLWGVWGPKGCFYWGLTNVPEKLEMNKPINVTSFSFSKKQFFIGLWLSMDHSKDNFKNNYVIFKPNYFLFFLIINFFLINLFNNFLPPFLIIISILQLCHSFFLSINMDMKKKKKKHVSFHVHEMYINLN
jgi:hypothetical protein